MPDESPRIPKNAEPEVRTKKGLLVATEPIRPAGVIGGTADTRNAQNTYAAGDVIAYIANLGVTPPQGFEAVDATKWHCIGWLDTSGGVFALSQTTKDVGAAGSLSAIRTVTTGGTKTLQFTALEALNPYARALFDNVPVSALAPVSRVDTVGTTNSSTTVTDVTAASGDIGASVSGTGIPSGAYIVSVTPGTGFTLSKPATATSTTVSATVTSGNSVYALPEVPQQNQYAVLLDTIDGNKAMRMFAPTGQITARGNDQVQQSDTENLQMTFTFYPTMVTVNGVSVRAELVRYVQYGAGNVPTSFVM